jgi:hypothetical protein
MVHNMDSIAVELNTPWAVWLAQFRKVLMRNCPREKV